MFRTKTLSQLLRLKISALIKAMQTRKEDNVIILKKTSFSILKDLNIGDLVVENGEEDVDLNMAFNLLTVASSGNAVFFYELLKAKFEPDIGDSKGRTPLSWG